MGRSFRNLQGVPRGGIARLNIDGTPDGTFGNGLEGVDQQVFAIQPLTNGQILIAGSFTRVNGSPRSCVARLNQDGTLDTGFANTSFGAGDFINFLTLQTDGKVLVGGSLTAANGLAKNLIARLNQDGTLDTGFDIGTADVGDVASCCLLQNDGKIILGGYFTNINGAALDGLARLNPTGSLDVTFISSLVGEIAVVTGGALQADGKIVVGGYFGVGNGSTLDGRARLNSDGTPDVSFAPVILNGNWGGSTSALALQADGKILIGGPFSGADQTGDFCIARIWAAAPRGPMLSTAISAGHLILSWPTNSPYGPWQIQASPTLNSSIWTNLNPQPDLAPVGDSFQAVLPLNGPGLFYRLSQYH